MTFTQTSPDLSGVETFFDGTYVHVLPLCADGVPGATMIPMTGFGAGFPCSCADDLLTSSFGRGTGVAARLAGNVPGSTYSVPTGDGSGSGRSTSREPSERQMGYLASLATKKFGTLAGPALVEAIKSSAATFTSRYVSTKIDEFLALPDFAGDEAQAPSSPVRSNRYAAECRLCHATVPAETGSLLKVGSSWVVEHIGGCPEKVAPVSAPATTSTVPDVPQGHYAYPSSGSNDLAFVRVDRPTEGRWAGRTFVKWVIGGHPDMPVRRDQVASVLASIVEFGIAEAGVRYGQEIGRCCRCNRSLTDETSRLLGIGPDCRTRS